MKKDVYSKVIEITPEMAKKWLESNTHNRRASESLIEYYTDQINKGRWSLNGEPIIFSDTFTLLDGQQRLMSVIRANKPITSVVTFNVSDETFTTIDSGKKRTIADVMSIKGVNNYTTVTSGIIKYESLKKQLHPKLLFNPSGSATYTCLQSSRRLKVSTDDVLDFYYANKNLLDRLAEFSVKYYHINRIMSTSEIFAYTCYLIIDKLHTEESVFGFFSQVLTGQNIENETIFLLRNRLIQNKTSNIKISSIYREAIIKRTWNNYLTGKSVTRFYFNDNEIDRIDFN